MVVADADGMGTRFYTYLFDLDPTAARLFSHVDMVSQRRKLMQSLAVVVGALDDPDRLMSAIGEFGRRHARYGVQDRHFDRVRDAWADAYALVASVMRRALIRNASESPVSLAS